MVTTLAVSDGRPMQSNLSKQSHSELGSSRGDGCWRVSGVKKGLLGPGGVRLWDGDLCLQPHFLCLCWSVPWNEVGRDFRQGPERGQAKQIPFPHHQQHQQQESS